MNYGYSKGINAYKNNSVTHASKEQLLLMLLDGAVKFSKRARLYMEEKNIQETHNNIVKTQNIFYELMGTLDVDAAGQWGQALFDIYNFIVGRLGEANIKKDTKIMDEVIPLIEDVKNTWDEAYKLSKR